MHIIIKNVQCYLIIVESSWECESSASATICFIDQECGRTAEANPDYSLASSVKMRAPWCEILQIHMTMVSVELSP